MIDFMRGASLITIMGYRISNTIKKMLLNIKRLIKNKIDSWFFFSCPWFYFGFKWPACLFWCVCSFIWGDDSHPESHHGRHHARSRHRRHDPLLLDVWGKREGQSVELQHHITPRLAWCRRARAHVYTCISLSIIIDWFWEITQKLIGIVELSW